MSSSSGITHFPTHLLAPRYSEPHRKYHNVEHINSMIREIYRVDVELQNTAYGFNHEQKSLLIVCAWLHDAHYDPKAPPGLNETESARIIREFDRYTGDRVRTGTDTVEYAANWLYDTIDATARHTQDQAGLTELSQLFLDIDLHELGANNVIYTQNGKNIRLEYAHVHEEEFRAGRITFLKAMLARKSIFYTKHMSDRYETAAYLNMEAELYRLEYP